MRSYEDRISHSSGWPLLRESMLVVSLSWRNREHLRSRAPSHSPPHRGGLIPEPFVSSWRRPVVSKHARPPINLRRGDQLHCSYTNLALTMRDHDEGAYCHK